MKEYLTAQELADLAVKQDWPNAARTKRGWFEFAKRNEWQTSGLTRSREGKGGGVEYHFSLLPEQFQVLLQASITRDVVVRKEGALVEWETKRRKALETTSLTSRQRAVMEARAAILTAIESHFANTGCSRRQAILHFITNPADFAISDTVKITANDKGDTNPNISKATLFRWFKFREEGVGALAPKTAKEKQKIPAWFEGFLKHYALPQKPTITEALANYRMSLAAGDDCPSYDQCKRMIARMGNVEKHKGREGPLTLKSRMAYISRSTDDILPTSIFTADGKTVDAEVAHPIHGKPFKPEVTTIVDVATRRIVGFYAGLAENSLDVVSALRHSVEQFGIPAIFYVDLGPGFKNQLLDDALTGFCGRLGITKMHSIARNSQARGIIERLNKTVWNPLSKQFVTYLGAEMDREAAQRVHKITRKEIREFGSSATLPTWEQFLNSCYKAIAHYNSKSHSSLPHKMSPDAYWEEHVESGFKPVHITPEESNDLWRPYEKRKVRRCLIEFNTNEYFASELEQYHGDWVLVGYDIHDASKVWIRELGETDDGYQMGRFICIAKFAGNEQRYVPHSVERAAIEKRAAGRIRRLKDKLHVVEQELNPNTLLEQSAQTPMEIIDLPETDLVPATPQPPRQKADVFASEADLAKWVLENPDQMKPYHRSVLEECLRSSTDRELFEEEGVDVERLRNVLRHAA